MSLQDAIHKQKKFMSKKTVWQLGIQITNLLEQLHSIGYVYNDLKPDNICIGKFTYKNEYQELHKIHLIDFGLSQKYKTEDGTHVQEG